ncbi:MAG: hypothetical protein AAB480_03735 [Patescibacteria group bacterium]
MRNTLGIFVVFVAVIALTFVPDLWATAKARWPGIFETNNPIPDYMPESWVLGCVVGFICIGLATAWWGPAGFMLSLYAGFFTGVIVMHVPPYVRHQYRRMRAR